MPCIHATTEYSSLSIISLQEHYSSRRQPTLHRQPTKGAHIMIITFITLALITGVMLNEAIG